MDNWTRGASLDYRWLSNTELCDLRLAAKEWKVTACSDVAVQFTCKGHEYMLDSKGYICEIRGH
jgi:hypothetical protein